jgi:hypothetical protein
MQIVQPDGDTKCIDGHTYVERSEWSRLDSRFAVGGYC